MTTTVDRTVLPPTGDCPKCGTTNAFSRAKPLYRSNSPFTLPDGFPGHERLEWDCDWCGYSKETPTADSVP